MSNKNTHIIYPGDTPINISVSLFRGSTKNISLIAKQKETSNPFDLSVFDSFELDFKVHPLQLEPVVNGPSNIIVLGSSVVNSIKDELHVILYSELFQELKYQRLIGDLDGIIGNERYTLGVFTLKLKYDGTHP